MICMVWCFQKPFQGYLGHESGCINIQFKITTASLDSWWLLVSTRSFILVLDLIQSQLLSCELLAMATNWDHFRDRWGLSPQNGTGNRNILRVWHNWEQIDFGKNAPEWGIVKPDLLRNTLWLNELSCDSQGILVPPLSSLLESIMTVYT